MNILFINRGMGIFRGGGETYDVNSALSLQNLDQKINFIVGKKLLETPTHPLIEFPTTYIATPYLRGLSYTLPKGGWIFSVIDQLMFNFATYRRLKKNIQRPDIIQLCGLPYLADFIRKKTKIPVVLRMPGPPSAQQVPLLAKVDAVIANGDAFKQITKHTLNQKINLYNIPPGVNHTIFQFSTSAREEMRKRYNFTPSDIVVIWVGRFVPIKNPELAISAFGKAYAKNPQLKLLMGGEGPLEQNLKKQIKELRLESQVIMTGHIPNQELPKYYAASDIFLLSSEYDNFPNVILEAMSCKLPVVATNVGGVNTQIEHQVNGLLAENHNAEGLAQAINTLAENKENRQKIGEINRNKVLQTYNWESVGKKLLEVYKQVLSSH
jgi:glycosyltransferase involved in cell wall biosynthesis